MMCEPQVFGLRAGSSLAKMPSDGRAGGPRLGLDTSLKSTRKHILYLKMCFLVELFFLIDFYMKRSYVSTFF